MTKSKLGRNPFQNKSSAAPKKPAPESSDTLNSASGRLPCLAEIKEALYWAAIGAGAQMLAFTLRSVLQTPIGQKLAR